MQARRGVVTMMVCALMAVVASAPAATHARVRAGCADAHLKAKRDNLGRVARAAACLVNAERAKAGLKPVHYDGRLARAARRHSRDMVDEGFFDHIAPNGSTPITRAERVEYIKPDAAWYLAENLGV